MENKDKTQTAATETKKFNDRYRRAGGLWKRQTKDGKGYLSGRITLIDDFGLSKDYSVSVWPNRNKVAGDTKFDYTVDIDTQATKDSPPRIKKPEVPTVESPASSVAAQNKAEELLGNPFEKEADVDKLI